MSETKKRTKNLTRSRRLRKYEESYEACINKVTPKPVKTSRMSRTSKSPSSLDESNTKHRKSPSKSHTKHRKESKKSTKSRKASPKSSRESKESKESVKSSTNIPSRRSRLSRSPYKSPKKKRPLNNYQQFVKDESQKDTYKHLSSSERMSAIGKAWKSLIKKLDAT